MKLVLAAAALSLASGCSTYVGKDGRWSYAAGYETRECRVEAANVPGATPADAFKSNDSLASASMKWGAEIEKCMQRKGYRKG